MLYVRKALNLWFYGPRVRVTRITLATWATFATITGFAQLFRTTIEMWTGAGMLFAASLMIAAILTRLSSVAFLGFGLLSAWCTARLVASFWLPDVVWHGTVLIVGAWGLLAHLSAEHAWSAYKISRVGLDELDA